MPINLDKLQQNLNYHFSDLELAERALTHRSANKLNNERLEFLGDSLLGFIIAEALFEIYPDADEGELSRMRASMVNKASLAEIARELELGDCMQLGAGELKSGGKHRESILADATEAIIAAIYLDGGMVACTQLVRDWSEQKLHAPNSDQKQKDFKTRLQELMQAKGVSLPRYEVIKITGEAHRQTFHVECTIADLEGTQRGVGRSKRMAEQAAAQKILDALGESP
ncbi:MAG: ribonuclease III [Proteobacteria bacterium]|nr:ribonuclease III [Pseudomonadota bacterium]